MCAHMQLEVTGQPQVSIATVCFCFETASLIGPELHQQSRHSWPVSPPVSKLQGACPSPHISSIAGTTSAFHYTQLFRLVFVAKN